MRKTLTLTTLIATFVLAGCAQHAAPISLHSPAPAAAQAKKPAPRKPLSLAIDGVHFDAMSRSAAVAALEARGFRPERVNPRYDCDYFSPPASLAGATKLTVCWVPARPARGAAWAESWIDYPASAAHQPKFNTLLDALTREFGGRGEFWLHSRERRIGTQFAAWYPAHKRGLVWLDQSYPRQNVRLKIADLARARELVESAARQAARAKAAHDASENPLVAHPPARARPAKTVRPAARAPRANPQRHAGIPSVTQVFRQSNRLWGK